MNNNELLEFRLESDIRHHERLIFSRGELFHCIKDKLDLSDEHAQILWNKIQTECYWMKE